VLRGQIMMAVTVEDMTVDWLRRFYGLEGAAT
jgi:hypothetical protein